MINKTCKGLIALLSSGLVVALALPAQAETVLATTNTNVTYAVNPVALMSVPGAITLTAPSPLSGVTSQNDYVVTLRTNIDWQVKIRGSSSTWPTSPRANKPVGDLWFKDLGGTWRAMSTTDQNVTNGAEDRTGATAANKTISFKAFLTNNNTGGNPTGTLDPPGTYTYSNVVITLF